MIEKIYFKIFFIFFVLVLIAGLVVVGKKEIVKREVEKEEEEETELLLSPSPEEVLPTKRGVLPSASPISLRDFDLSTSSRIGQFGEGWEWVKRLNQDGKYAETNFKIEIDDQREIREAILIFNPYYFGEGMGEYEVYISDKKQVKERDEKHNFMTWWVGDEIESGKALREEIWRCSEKGEVQAWEVTDLVKERRMDEYFVAFWNKASGGIEIPEVYLRVIYHN
jgi:hypothetical protein